MHGLVPTHKLRQHTLCRTCNSLHLDTDLLQEHGAVLQFRHGRISQDIHSMVIRNSLLQAMALRLSSQVTAHKAITNRRTRSKEATRLLHRHLDTDLLQVTGNRNKAEFGQTCNNRTDVVGRLIKR